MKLKVIAAFGMFDKGHVFEPMSRAHGETLIHRGYCVDVTNEPIEETAPDADDQEDLPDALESHIFKRGRGRPRKVLAGA